MLIVDPWFTPETIIDGHAGVIADRFGDVVVTRMSYGVVEGDVSLMDMHHVVARMGRGVRYYVEQHRMGLFRNEEYADILHELGFAAERLDDLAWSDRCRWGGVLT